MLSWVTTVAASMTPVVAPTPLLPAPPCEAHSGITDIRDAKFPIDRNVAASSRMTPVWTGRECLTVPGPLSFIATVTASRAGARGGQCTKVVPLRTGPGTIVPWHS
ncbi:hypothetical protein GCM10023169_31940 [Georgenia halophila]|uniref:Secreted protein n=1 Tax=Georgenia halophila TaxID=620889 RepID=A0ABP8LIC3_9MICO